MPWKHCNRFWPELCFMNVCRPYFKEHTNISRQLQNMRVFHCYAGAQSIPVAHRRLISSFCMYVRLHLACPNSWKKSRKNLNLVFRLNTTNVTRANAPKCKLIKFTFSKHVSSATYANICLNQAAWSIVQKHKDRQIEQHTGR